MKVDKEELYAYIRSMVGVEIADSTCFFDDLGLIGLDAEQMMIQLAGKYHLDLTDYDPARYHLSEGEITNVLLHLRRAISGKLPRHLSFSALHLYEVVRAGKWFDPLPRKN